MNNQDALRILEPVTNFLAKLVDTKEVLEAAIQAESLIPVLQKKIEALNAELAETKARKEAELADLEGKLQGKRRELDGLNAQMNRDMDALVAEKTAMLAENDQIAQEIAAKHSKKASEQEAKIADLEKTAMQLESRVASAKAELDRILSKFSNG